MLVPQADPTACCADCSDVPASNSTTYRSSRLVDLHCCALLTADEGATNTTSRVATSAATRERRSNTRNLRVDRAFARDKVAVDLNESPRPGRVGVVSGIALLARSARTLLLID